MFAQGLLNIYLTLYVWEDPERIEKTASPNVYSRPEQSFTVLLPARHEESVIGDTIKSIYDANYPQKLIEILVICEVGDVGTIEAANHSITANNIHNAKVITFNDKPINKPHGLNLGLSVAKHENIVIFDAEDDVDKDIFNIANTVYIVEKPDIIQAGVQLMDYGTKWFSVHNVLEYFFWFKSRMHFHTSVGMVPLGGNTVFFKTNQLKDAKGWNEECLTEDAEIGIRMSTKGAKVYSTYDPRHITKEETPDSIRSFIKQRTRWNQGFIQVLRYGHWKHFDTTFKKLLCLYVLSFPITQGILFLLTPIIIAIGVYGDLPVVISLFSFTPILLLAVQLVIYIIGLHEFLNEQKLKIRYSVFPMMILTFIPYQFLLGYSAMRASWRELRGINNWEKTAHSGLHRNQDVKNNVNQGTVDNMGQIN